MQYFDKLQQQRACSSIVSNLRSTDSALCSIYSNEELDEVVRSVLLRLSDAGVKSEGAVYIYVTLFLASNGLRPEERSPFNEILGDLENRLVPEVDRLEQASAMLLDLDFGIPKNLRSINPIATPELDV